MKRVGMFVAVLLFFSGIAFAQQPPSAYEHLNGFDLLIGTWVYEGPTLEDAPDHKKGTKITVHIAYERRGCYPISTAVPADRFVKSGHF